MLTFLLVDERQNSKTPGFPKKNGKPGAFCVLWVILIYLQLLSSVFLILGGEMAAMGGRTKEKHHKIIDKTREICYILYAVSVD